MGHGSGEEPATGALPPGAATEWAGAGPEAAPPGAAGAAGPAGPAGVVPIERIPGGHLAGWIRRADFALLPLASLEWHGPHMPLGTDLILARGLAERLRGEFTALLYPPFVYTACPGKTRHYPGTVALRAEVALAVLCDVLRGILDAGFVRVLLLNAHDANMAIARAAAEAVTGERRASILLVNWWQMVSPEETAGLFRGEPGDARPGRGHGGPFEASATAALAPESVDPALAPELPPRRPPEAGRPYVLVESNPEPWAGYAGFVRDTSVQAGRFIVERTLEHLERLIAAWLRAPLPGDPPGRARDG
ncbi:creatininase [Thermaerobacter marianensis DSM 12885]|uniref:Creatininase n=1 Tax=Thermaerobacter marianensis (strain ATCC 700841 / DSM 12885 / JCM 10246 / 7p75a) TaxID=644966 RepID=E6SI48_THEM7|nr:creatininase family protein [Thermaerobacter marianensis]ADU50826.1 creatininase [Thermaerobacter marianensis DSM 12885]